MALRQPMPPPQSASRQICEREIWWRPAVEERLHLAGHILGSLFFKSGQYCLGKEYRESSLGHRVGQDLFRRANAIICWIREAQQSRYKQVGSGHKNNRRTDQTDTC